MKRVLITGMSGTGKSTLIGELSTRGYNAIDFDSPEWSEWVDYVSTGASDSPVEPGRDWVWREDRVQEVLSRQGEGVLFVSGCAVNMRKFYPSFTHIILLSAPPAVILERLARRTNNSYGKSPEEAARVLSLIHTVEPLLRKRAGYEIDTSVPLEQVVETLLRWCNLGSS